MNEILFINDVKKGEKDTIMIFVYFTFLRKVEVEFR